MELVNQNSKIFAHLEFDSIFYSASEYIVVICWEILVNLSHFQLESERIIVAILVSVCWVPSEAQARDWFAACRPLSMWYRNSLQLSKEHSNTMQFIVFHDKCSITTDLSLSKKRLCYLFLAWAGSQESGVSWVFQMEDKLAGSSVYHIQISWLQEVFKVTFPQHMRN